MKIIKISNLTEQWTIHRETEAPLREWIADTKSADWASPQDVKNRYPGASIIADNRVVFNIKGNSYRLITHINYPYRIVYIKFFGTHADYDKIDAATVNDY
jgi:mRNA interferase HigB